MKHALSAAAAALLALAAPAQAQTPPMTPDIPATFRTPADRFDYEKRVVMIPMRDGVRLHTVMIVPKGAKDAPILLTRTPYNAKKSAERNVSPAATATGSQMDEAFLADGYIRVYQDVRGKYGSEGDYVLTRPVRGPLNATAVDHVTDAYDTIDWLVKNVAESNGRVGMIGSSYPGFTTAMALVDPHPALKAAVPQSPMIDGWMGDDWFQNGAFRQTMLGWFASQMTVRGLGDGIAKEALDDYDNFLRAGSAGEFARRHGLDQIPAFRKMTEHPAYDAFWQEQALDRILAQRPLKVPTLWVGALFDQEDIYGALHAYQATEAKDAGNHMNFLALGPWRHSGVNYEQRQLGAVKLPGDTATDFRRRVLKPFLDQHLKTNGPKAGLAPVTIFETGTMEWRSYPKWPLACARGCESTMRPLYLQPGLKLGFERPAGGAAYDEYVSDPAKPVPYVPRPVRADQSDQWRFWLVSDQRHAATRPDVLTYVSEPLTAPLQVSGEPVVNLFASTSGTDSDWVVKLIDVHPDFVASDLDMSGYQMPVALEIFRGRYRDSLETPTAIPAGKVQKYRFELPTTNHVFLPGHRIMVQVQSSLFPLYDRNPQTFTPNIFFAKPSDYRKATQRVFHTGAQASAIELPVVEAR
ncbi:CocE/NonD family hydrolase [Phenylobacterium sp.]|uniref:CocE/NonD family hydrolase n=1 Tax=Phenylobacterium sp. TaxID=1871053 RepID=UPI002C64EB0F|nr:CocE/NonD family hydrolase [Phenylobacterium sp.]HVI34052.1 CocE/NonD family hydrolase [Phenylobacterium sp.]